MGTSAGVKHKGHSKHKLGNNTNLKPTLISDQCSYLCKPFHLSILLWVNAPPSRVITHLHRTGHNTTGQSDLDISSLDLKTRIDLSEKGNIKQKINHLKVTWKFAKGWAIESSIIMQRGRDVILNALKPYQLRVRNTTWKSSGLLSRPEEEVNA